MKQRVSFSLFYFPVDRTPPAVSGDGDQTVTIPLGSGGTSVTWNEPRVTDNSGRFTLVSRSHSPGSQFPPGTTTVTYVYSDPSGNIAIYEFDVTVDEGNLFIYLFILFIYFFLFIYLFIYYLFIFIHLFIFQHKSTNIQKRQRRDGGDATKGNV